MLIKCLLCTRHCAGWYAYKTSFDGHIDLLRIFPVSDMGTLRLRSNLLRISKLQSGGAGREIAAAAGSKLSTLPSHHGGAGWEQGPEYSSTASYY